MYIWALETSGERAGKRERERRERERERERENLVDSGDLHDLMMMIIYIYIYIYIWTVTLVWFGFMSYQPL